jgi:hypothetical protein
MSEDLARALERRSLRAWQVAIATSAAVLALAARHASPDLHVTAIAAACAVVTFVVAFALAHHEVRERSIDALEIAPPRRVRSVARSLERLARAAESGHAQLRQTRPPRSVLQLAPEADMIRELAALLRSYPEPPSAAVAACDRFVVRSWNGGLYGFDHDLLRRELGRVRYTLAA